MPWKKKHYKLYWYGFVRKMLQRYRCIERVSNPSEIEKSFLTAAVRAKEETAAMQDGTAETRIKVIELFVTDQYSIGGIAERAYISRRMVTRYISDYVHATGCHMGFKRG